MSSKPKRRVAEIAGFRTDAERLIAYLDGQHDQLTPKDQEKFHRVTTCRGLLLQHQTGGRVAAMMMNTFGISEATAWRDIRLCEQVFGPLLQISKDLRRAIADEMIAADRELAKVLKDAKTLAACTRNYIILHGLDKEDQNLPDLSDLEVPQVIVAVLPEQVGVDPPNEDDLLKRVEQWYQKQGVEVDSEDVQSESGAES